MLAVSGLAPQHLNKVIAKVNEELRSKATATAKAGPALVAAQAQLESLATLPPLHLSLINAPKSCVVSGRPQALMALKDAVDRLGSQGANQARVPFSKRKPDTSASFLKTASFFHCELNRPAYELILGDMVRVRGGVGRQAGRQAGRRLTLRGDDGRQQRLGLLALEPLSLRFPVQATDSGEALAGPDLLARVCLMQAVLVSDFTKVRVPAAATHVLEFGPGGGDGLGGAGKLLARAVEGMGLAVVLCRPYAVAELPPYLRQLSRAEPLQGERAEDWAQRFGPRVVRRECDGALVVDTKFTRLVGKPPVVMPGMTPTTSFLGIDLVAACNAAGFHGELAAGGLPLPEYFEAKVMELVAKQPPGTGIAVNMLYLNAYLWGFQFPLVCDLARRGVPIETITIAAGVPTPSVAEDILAKLCVWRAGGRAGGGKKLGEPRH
jgi:hypothetical protein